MTIPASSAALFPSRFGIVGIARCVRAGAALIGVLVLGLLWSMQPFGRRAFPVAAWSLLARGFGVRIRCHGDPAAGHGTLFVANHMSWIDIMAIGRLLDAGFVAKAEVGRWPVIGALSRRYGCLFLDRNRRRSAAEQARAVDRHLAAGRDLVLFPEGTTGDGDGVLPFRSSLFATGDKTRTVHVQPVAVSYSGPRREPLTPAERRAIAWLDDDALLPHAFALAARGGCTVDIWFEEPFAIRDRKALANRSRAAIITRLDSVRPLR